MSRKFQGRVQLDSGNLREIAVFWLTQTKGVPFFNLMHACMHDVNLHKNVVP